MKRSTLTSLAFAAVTASVSAPQALADVTSEKAEAIAKEAYVYGFPMVMNYKTMWNYWIVLLHPKCTKHNILEVNQWMKCESMIVTLEYSIKTL